jgi:ribosomal-protein-alanine N-acetyltransferase
VVTTRLVSVDDVTALTDLAVRNGDFLAPWDPVHPEAHVTEEGQLAAVLAALARHHDGTAMPHVIVDDDGELVGRITLNGIVRGPFLSCSVGYWVSEDRTRRGVATAAVAAILRVAFEDLGLHRVQAETLLHNMASQEVLRRTGFQSIGMAPAYLRIAGEWQDHLLFQRINPAAV